MFILKLCLFFNCNIGIGGQVDFIRGAAIAFDGLGKPILAMPSVTNRKESKIVPYLKQGMQNLLDLLMCNARLVCLCIKNPFIQQL